jgi:hypothetical protein
MTYKFPPVQQTVPVLVDKGAWTTGNATAQNNIWSYTPAGGAPQRWVDTVGGGTLPASPAAGNGTTPGRYVEEGEIATGTLYAQQWSTTATQTAAFTATVNSKNPVDTTTAAFAVTLPGAVVSSNPNQPTRVFLHNVAAPTVTNVATITPGGTDTINLPASMLPLTIAPGESVELECLVAGKWSLV